MQQPSITASDGSIGGVLLTNNISALLFPDMCGAEPSEENGNGGGVDRGTRRSRFREQDSHMAFRCL